MSQVSYSVVKVRAYDPRGRLYYDYETACHARS